MTMTTNYIISSDEAALFGDDIPYTGQGCCVTWAQSSLERKEKAITHEDHPEEEAVLLGRNLAKRTRAMTTHWLFSNKYFYCPHNDLLSERYMLPSLVSFIGLFGSSGHCLSVGLFFQAAHTMEEEVKEGRHNL